MPYRDPGEGRNWAALIVMLIVFGLPLVFILAALGLIVWSGER